MFRFVHNNILVSDMEKSIQFYVGNLGFTVRNRSTSPELEYDICHMTHPSTNFELELTSYPKGDYKDKLKHELQGEFHIAFYCDDFENTFKKHKEQGIVVFENLDWDLYFIGDPDGHWVEIMKGE